MIGQIESGGEWPAMQVGISARPLYTHQITRSELNQGGIVHILATSREDQAADNVLSMIKPSTPDRSIFPVRAGIS